MSRRPCRRCFRPIALLAAGGLWLFPVPLSPPRTSIARPWSSRRPSRRSSSAPRTATLTVITRDQIRRPAGGQHCRRAADGGVGGCPRPGRTRRPDRLRGPRRRLRAGAGAGGRRAPERRAVGTPQRRHPGAAGRRGAHRGPARPGSVALRRRRLRRHRQRHHPAQRRRPVPPCSGGPTGWPAAARSGERGAAAEPCAVGLVGPLGRLHVRPRLRDHHRAFAVHVRRPDACRPSRGCGRSSAPTTSTAATRLRASGPTRRSSR